MGRLRCIQGLPSTMPWSMVEMQRGLSFSVLSARCFQLRGGHVPLCLSLPLPRMCSGNLFSYALLKTVKKSQDLLNRSHSQDLPNRSHSQDLLNSQDLPNRSHRLSLDRAICTSAPAVHCSRHIARLCSGNVFSYMLSKTVKTHPT